MLSGVRDEAAIAIVELQVMFALGHLGESPLMWQLSERALRRCIAGDGYTLAPAALAQGGRYVRRSGSSAYARFFASIRLVVAVATGDEDALLAAVPQAQSAVTAYDQFVPQLYSAVPAMWSGDWHGALARLPSIKPVTRAQTALVEAIRALGEAALRQDDAARARAAQRSCRCTSPPRSWRSCECSAPT